jgi:spore coat polysaccharide biosynthesis protein SpsF
MDYRVTIGIQARSTSTRLPGKIFERIGGKEILEHVIEACEQSCNYLNRNVARNQLKVGVVLLIPFNDNKIIEHYGRRIPIIEGEENNVLDRFRRLHNKNNHHYYVRVTSDCPFIPPFLISKHINTAVQGRYDYVSNVDVDTRTSVDGHDVEVMSREALEWLLINAKTDEQKEHVTLAIRQIYPPQLRAAHIIGHIDTSGMKLSIDTETDLLEARGAFERLENKINIATIKSGPHSIHRV